MDTHVSGNGGHVLIVDGTLPCRWWMVRWCGALWLGGVEYVARWVCGRVEGGVVVDGGEVVGG